MNLAYKVMGVVLGLGSYVCSYVNEGYMSIGLLKTQM